MHNISVKDRFVPFIHQLQNEICAALEQADGEAKFREDRWERPEGGGGITRVISGGNVFQKGGVNTSVVSGKLPPVMAQQFKVPDNSSFLAAGLSLVIHPENPYVPTVHANWRYFELYGEDGSVRDMWFGGGADLTPYYILEGDGEHFHRTFKEACGRYYEQYKRQCDEYFVNKHRNNEARGIGGVFYDYLRPSAERTAEDLLQFQFSNGNAFISSYLPIVEKRKTAPYGEAQVEWQEYRRGRYVEFNLIHDRGTLFGLKTNGRIESILMSLPARARWEYDYHPAPGSPEAELLEYLKPREWVKP